MGHRPHSRTFTQRLRALHKAEKDRNARFDAMSKAFGKLGHTFIYTRGGRTSNLMADALSDFKKGARQVISEIQLDAPALTNVEGALKAFTKALRKAGFRVTVRRSKERVVNGYNCDEQVFSPDPVRIATVTVSI